MIQTEAATRPERTATENLIVVKTDDGYRVYSPLTPAKQFVVRDNGVEITCTCSEFERHRTDPEWRCKHMLAVTDLRNTHQEQNGANPQNRSTQNGSSTKNGAELSINGQAPQPMHPAFMLIKRSVSPDGRIDSLSVEFSLPVAGVSSEEIKLQAARALQIETEIMQRFLKGTDRASGRSNGHTPEGAPAQLLNIAAMETRKGRSLFLNVLVNNQITKFFGGQKEIGEALIAAGYPQRAAQITEGITLNLPCRVTTKQNGKYLNIDRIMPADNGGAK